MALVDPTVIANGMSQERLPTATAFVFLSYPEQRAVITDWMITNDCQEIVKK
jgi:hypothetical protein